MKAIGSYPKTIDSFLKLLIRLLLEASIRRLNMVELPEVTLAGCSTPLHMTPMVRSVGPPTEQPPLLLPSGIFICHSQVRALLLAGPPL